MEFQNCVKFHLPNGSWNFLEQFRNITRGIYTKNQYKSSYYLYKFPKHYQLKREQTFYVTSIIYKS